MDKNKVIVQGNETEPAAETESRLRCAYTVGIQEDGRFIFNVAGSQQGLVELLGLHALAKQQIQTVVDSKLGTGDALTAQIAKALMQLTGPPPETPPSSST